MTTDEPAHLGADGALQEGAASGVDLAGWTLARRIEHLFATLRKDDGSPYSITEVARGMAEPISDQYLSYLRSGKRDNPTKKHLEALANFFRVKPSYFFDEDESLAIAEQLVLLRALADAGISHIATRLIGVSSDGQKNVAALVEMIRKIEGLDGKKGGKAT